MASGLVHHIPVVAPVLSQAAEIFRIGLALTIVPLSLFAFWAISFKRTPWSVALAGVAGAWSLGGIAAALSLATDAGSSIGAVIGVAAVFVITASLLVAGIEVDNTQVEAWREHDDELTRKEHEERHLSRPWGVAAVIDPEADDGVEIRVVNGSYHKPIGKVDPIHELDHFNQHMADAQEAASTLNSLSVRVAPGKEIARR